MRRKSQKGGFPSLGQPRKRRGNVEQTSSTIERSREERRANVEERRAPSRTSLLLSAFSPKLVGFSNFLSLSSFFLSRRDFSVFGIDRRQIAPFWMRVVQIGSKFAVMGV